MDKMKRENVSGCFVLTPAAGKKLIGLAVAALPEVQHAFKHGRLAVANGTTTACVIEALTGREVRKYDYCAGVVTNGMFAENHDSDHTLKYWENGQERDLPFADFADALKAFEKDDVFIKGANAIDPHGCAGGLQTNPQGGSWATAYGVITARGLRCIVPVGLEKMIPSVVEASKRMGQLRLTYAFGDMPGLIPLPSFTTVTEIQALHLLTGVTATVVAAGGIGGSEGARAFVVEGSEGQVKKAFEIMQQVRNAPAVEITGRITSKPHRLPT